MFLILVFSVLIIADLALFISDKYITSFFLLLGTLIASYFFVPESAQVIATYGWMGLFTILLPSYLGIGIGVAVVKWFLYNLKIASRIKEAVEKFKIDRPTASMSNPEKREKFTKYWNDRYYPNISTYQNFEREDCITEALTPKAKKEVDRISFWILQWPIVIIATILEDLLIKLGKHVADLFDYLFNQLARKLIGNATKGL